MKTECDNMCDTCTMQTKVHCALIFSKKNNDNQKAIFEKLEELERFLNVDNQIPLNPCGGNKSAEEPIKEI